MATALKPGTTDYKMRGERELVYTRVFAAPRDLVFAMFTEAKHLPNWLGMPEDTMEVVEQDLRVGGKYRWEFYRGEDLQVAIYGDFTEIVAGEFVAHNEVMEFGGTTTPATRCTLAFTEDDGLTTMVGTIEFPDSETAKMALDSGMKQGMDIGFDRLDTRLAALA